jgi:hypothetical protein
MAAPSLVQRAASQVAADGGRSRRAAAGAPGRVIALQRTIGNAAVGRLVEARRRAVQRACCASCAAGHECEREDED